MLHYCYALCIHVSNEPKDLNRNSLVLIVFDESLLEFMRVCLPSEETAHPSGLPRDLDLNKSTVAIYMIE